MSAVGERREVIFQGRVQGVGFRYTTRRLAARFHLTGFVRNQPDGTVQLLVEGESAELDRLIGAVAEEFAGSIVDQQVQVSPATGEFKTFDVRF